MAAMLEGMVDKVVQVVTNDGRNIVGLLKGFALENSGDRGLMTAEEVAAFHRADFRGKTALITGANTGVAPLAHAACSPCPADCAGAQGWGRRPRE